MRAPPRPEEGAVSWNVNTACNYRCTYCTQRFKDDRGRWSRDTPRFLEAFARLPGRWEIKLSGGEPFVHPTLDAIVSGLAKLGHRVSVVTNLSASEERLARFVDAAAGRIGVVSCSLHLEYVTSDGDVARFRDKARWLADLVASRADASLPKPSLNVTTVATVAALPRLDDLAALFAGASLEFKVQPERQEGVLVAYAPHDRERLVALGGHNRTGAIAHAYRGQPCWSGARHFILDDRGDAYRCYPARRARLERVGSFLDPAFRLADEATPCLYERCYCTVPIARGMMGGAVRGARANEEEL